MVVRNDMSNDWQIKKVEEIYPIREDTPDDLFITCGSFEERFLGIPKKLKGDFPKEFILFKFTEPNRKREELIRDMEEMLTTTRYKKSYHQIDVEHGNSLESILKFHDFLNTKKLSLRNLFITVDISTFTKDLLLNLMFYLIDFLQIKKLRLLYTIPGRYASPQEGWLSSGIKKIHIPPMSWNEWSPLKENLLVILLGFEEMRAWSLIDTFSADLNWLFITNPGSKSEWDTYGEAYNKKLLEEMPPKDKIPALDPIKVSEILARHITKDISEKYNIFISHLGTKPQLISTLHFYKSHPYIPINLITTTVVNYNIPYYSWDIGESFEFFFTIKEESDNE